MLSEIFRIERWLIWDSAHFSNISIWLSLMHAKNKLKIFKYFNMVMPYVC